ncbi:MAG: hypothetical protein ABFD84_11210 [Candidatus Polarisedimenticolia bacterium]
MACSPRKAFIAMGDALAEIASANGYNTDLNGVVPRFVLPGEPGAPDVPFVCVELNDAGDYETPDSVVKAKIRVPVHGFVADVDAASFADSAAVAAYALHDDILRAVMPDPGGPWNLGVAGIDDVTPVSKEISAGVFNGRGFVWVQIDFEVAVYFDRTTLARS